MMSGVLLSPISLSRASKQHQDRARERVRENKDDDLLMVNPYRARVHLLLLRPHLCLYLNAAAHLHLLRLGCQGKMWLIIITSVNAETSRLETQGT